MTRPVVKRDGDGSYRVAGPMVFDTVPELYPKLKSGVSGGGQLVLDLGEVERSDTAGLALLVEGLRLARRHGTRLRFRNIPEQLRAMIRVNGLERAFAD